MNAGQRFCLRSQKSPVAMSPQICTPPLMRRPVQTMISVRVGRSCRTAFRDAIVRFALRRPFAGAAFAWRAADVAVGHGLEPLHDVTLVRQAAAEHVGQDRGCTAGNRYRCVHGAVSFMPVSGNGGDALPRTSDRRPASGRTPLLAA